MKKHLLSLLAITMMIATTIQAQIPTNGLVAYYPFNGNANDSSGNGKNGTVYSANSTVKYVTGKYGQGIYLKGSGHTGTQGDYVILPPVGLNNYPSYTISLWVKQDGDADSLFGHGENFIGGHSAANSCNGTFALSYGGKAPYFGFGYSNGYIGGSGTYVNGDLGSWILHTLVIDSGTAYCYKNGVLFATSPGTTRTDKESEIGVGTHWFCSGGTQSTRFLGGIDDIRIYNRALKSSEVQALFNGGTTSVASITSFNPTTASTGATITIKGISFTGATAVSFGGTTASSFIVVNDSTITAIVSNGASGNVQVVSPNGTASLGGFVYNATNPLIGSYTMVKNKIHFQESGNDYYDSIVANLGYLNLSKNGIAYLKSIWSYNTSDPKNIIIDTSKAIFDTFNYVINIDTVSFYKSNSLVASSIITNNRFIIHQLFSSSPLNEAWDYFYLNGGSLPLNIVSLTAEIRNEGSVSLNWHTSTEQNTSFFIVQHSTDGKSFKEICRVNAIGSGANSYKFTDYTTTIGTNYYRLQSVDKDGSSSYSKVVSVNFGGKQAFSIIPNPARDFATISFSKTVDKATIAVYDITGKAVITQSVSGTNAYKLNTQTLTNGVYVIKVNTTTGSYNEKLLINK